MRDGPGKTFWIPGKCSNFLSVKVWEPSSYFDEIFSV